MRNNRGALTIDYMFAFMLVSGLSLVIVTFSATFSVVEIVQYMTFSAARNYYAGNISESAQKAQAEKKWNELASNDAIRPLLSGGWFTAKNSDVIIDSQIPLKYPEFQGYNVNEERSLFHGVVVFFSAKILEFQIPFFGSTKKSDGSVENGFNAHIGSYLGREPSFDECNKFNEERWNAIRKLGDNMSGAPYSQAGSGSGYVVMNDNGC